MINLKYGGPLNCFHLFFGGEDNDVFMEVPAHHFFIFLFFPSNFSFYLLRNMRRLYDLPFGFFVNQDALVQLLL